MVEVMVSFSRAMYAQLVQQVFQAPRRYPMPPLSSPQFKAAELGMKLTCGFEMMYWERAGYEPQEGMQNQNTPDDTSLTTPVKLDGVPDSDPGWQVFRSSLQNRGYFKGLMEGSKEHRQLLQAAVERYQESMMFARVRYVTVPSLLLLLLHFITVTSSASFGKKIEEKCCCLCPKV
jgi:hypothetical protein